MLAKDPAQRPQNMREVATELKQALEGELAAPGSSMQTEPVVAPAASASLHPMARRRWPMLPLVGVLTGGVGLGLWLLHPRSELRVRPPAPGASRAVAAGHTAPALPPELVALGPGRFLLGAGNDKASLDGPAHAVQVPRFLIGRYEVSMADYRAFLAATAAPGPVPWEGVADFASIAELPVNQVARAQAAAYCRWKYPQLVGRLPTEQEWEYAARDGHDDRVFPWPAKRLEPGLANVAQQPPRLQPVSAFSSGATEHGLFNMIGNVAEWTASSAAPYPGHAGSAAELPSAELAVVRGGGADAQLRGMSATRRFFVDARRADPFIGFRCAADAPTPH